jgi:hypothetical protein
MGGVNAQVTSDSLSNPGFPHVSLLVSWLRIREYSLTEGIISQSAFPKQFSLISVDKHFIRCKYPFGEFILSDIYIFVCIN